MPTIALCTGSHRRYSRRPSLSFSFRICSCFPPFSIALRNSQKYQRKRTSAPAGHTRDKGERVAMHQNFRILLNISSPHNYPPVRDIKLFTILQPKYTQCICVCTCICVYRVGKKNRSRKISTHKKLCTRLFPDSLPHDSTHN